MDKFGVQLALEGIAEARSEWGKAKSKFDRQVDWMMERLLNEAAANMMSADQVAKASGLTTKRIRALMRKVGLDPRNGKKLLAHTAAEALASNAEIMGVEPHEIDLMSPLAYLPMGKELREKFLETKEQGMNESSGQTVTEGWWCRKCEFFEVDDEINTTMETCQLCGCVGAEHMPVEVVAK